MRGNTDYVRPRCSTPVDKITRKGKVRKKKVKRKDRQLTGMMPFGISFVAIKLILVIRYNGWSKTFVILATLSLAVIFIEFADILVAQWSTLKARRGGTRVKCGWLLALQGTLTRKKSNRRSSTSNLSSRTVMRTMQHSRFMVRTLVPETGVPGCRVSSLCDLVD